MYVQENYEKKLLKLELSYAGGFGSYRSKYLTVIKLVSYDKYDMLTHENSKFLFYQYNDYLDRNKRPMGRVKHTIILEDEVGLCELQRENWHKKI